MTSLVVTDAWLRFIVCNGGDDRTDAVFRLSMYEVADIRVDEVGHGKFGGPFPYLEVEIRDDETTTYRIKFDEADTRAIVSFVSDRIDALEAAKRDLSTAASRAIEGQSDFDSGANRGAIEAFDGALESVECAAFEHESDIGLRRTTDGEGWNVEATTPASENWLKTLGIDLTHRLGVETSDLTAVVSTLHIRRQKATTRLLKGMIDEAETLKERGRHLDAAEGYRETKDALAEFGECLADSAEDEYAGLGRARIDELLAAARELMNEDEYEEADAVYDDALSAVDDVTGELGADDTHEYQARILRRRTACLARRGRSTDRAADTLRRLVHEWPEHRDVVAESLADCTERHSDRVAALTNRISRSFDGTEADAGVAYVLRELLESYAVDIDVDEASVIGLLDSDIAKNRRSACEILAVVGGETAIEAVRDLHDDPDYETRVAALRATKTIANRTGASLSETEKQRMKDVEIVHWGEGDIVTGTQEETVIEDSVVNRSAINADTEGNREESNPQSGAATDAKISFCPSCGVDFDEFGDVRFCPSCGTELPPNGLDP